MEKNPRYKKSSKRTSTGPHGEKVPNIEKKVEKSRKRPPIWRKIMGRFAMGANVYSCHPLLQTSVLPAYHEKLSDWVLVTHENSCCSCYSVNNHHTSVVIIYNITTVTVYIIHVCTETYKLNCSITAIIKI